METTKIIVEYIAAGIIICLAILALCVCLFPVEIQDLFIWMSQKNSILETYSALVIILISAIIYTFGILAEYFGVITFDWLYKRRQKKSFKVYLHNHKNHLVNTPLGFYFNSFKEENVKKVYGEMRFYILAYNAPLSDEINAQINRYRLIRVTFWAEFIFLISIIILMFKAPSWILGAGLLFFLGTLVLNFYAIQGRFDRYIRAIERSYLVLHLEKGCKDIDQVKIKTPKEAITLTDEPPTTLEEAIKV